MERLILFDIDGTLLTSAGAAARPFRAALEAVFGTSGPTRGYSFAGRTDPQIARDLLSLGGVEVDPSDPRLDLLLLAIGPLALAHRTPSPYLAFQTGYEQQSAPVQSSVLL